MLVIGPGKWRISVVERDHPGLTLEPVLARDR
jgi:peptide chain release factor 3